MITGLIIGLLFGFVLKRSRMCFVGQIRDIYLEKRKTGIYVFLSIILLQSLIYFTLVQIGMIQGVQYKNFSLISIAIGGFLFGVGCIFAHGCITISLVKTGDGRLSGIISLLGFAIFASAARQGFLKETTAYLYSTAPISDNLVPSLPFSILIIVIPLLLIILYLSLKDYQKNRLRFKFPTKYTGIRHLLFEKVWDVRLTAIIIGLIAGLAWYLVGALGITGNVISLNNFLVNGNNAGIGWGSFFIIGIIVGSFICTTGSFEFSFKGADGKTLIMALIGGALMGVGSIWAQGCMLGNGLIGTATFSLKAWYCLLFIALGIWVPSYFFYAKPLNRLVKN